jgi:hypothetical protein
MAKKIIGLGGNKIKIDFLARLAELFFAFGGLQIGNNRPKTPKFRRVANNRRAQTQGRKPGESVV